MITSQIEAAFRAMLVHKAEGRWHDAIAALYGVPRPRDFSEAVWVNAIHAVAIGARTHPKAVFRFIEMALHDYAESRLVDTDASTPTRLLEGTGGPFTSDHVDRLVRVRGVLYRSTEELGPSGAWLGLTSYRSSDFELANFTTATGLTARFLPFRVREATGGPRLNFIGTQPSDWEVQAGRYAGSGMMYEVKLDHRDFSPPPRTYVRVSPVARTSDPFGGHLFLDATKSADALGAGHPLYLDNGKRLRQLTPILEDLLAAGVSASISIDGDIW